jgi:methylamine dehydrogenase accessory protein MauD
MQKEERAWLRIIFASDGEEKEHKRLIVSEGLAEFPYVLSLQLGMKFEVSRLPFAVLMDDKGILKSKGLVNTREHLESLVQAAERDVGSLQEYMAKEIYKNDRSNLSYKVENS